MEKKMISSKLLFGFLIFILVFHAIATVNFWYWQYLWLDMPMHFLGGFWVAMAFIYLIFNHQFPISNESFQPKADQPRAEKQKFLSFFIIILSLVALIGVFWEFYEFLSDIFLSSRNYAQIFQQGAADTIGDLFFDLFGGFVFLLIYRLMFKKKNII